MLKKKKMMFLFVTLKKKRFVQKLLLVRLYNKCMMLGRQLKQIKMDNGRMIYEKNLHLCNTI